MEELYSRCRRCRRLCFDRRVQSCARVQCSDGSLFLLLKSEAFLVACLFCRSIIQLHKHYQRQSQSLHFLPAADREPRGVTTSNVGRKKLSFISVSTKKERSGFHNFLYIDFDTPYLMVHSFPQFRLS